MIIRFNSPYPGISSENLGYILETCRFLEEKGSLPGYDSLDLEAVKINPTGRIGEQYQEYEYVIRIKTLDLDEEVRLTQPQIDELLAVYTKKNETLPV